MPVTVFTSEIAETPKQLLALARIQIPATDSVADNEFDKVLENVSKIDTKKNLQE